MSEQKGSEIKLEVRDEMEEIEKMTEFVDMKWEIKNKELNNKDEIEINIKDEEQR